MYITKDEITRALRIFGNRRKCAECPLRDAEFCLHIMTTCATDLIEQQTARIAELEAKVPRWIPVTERLPECEKEVLILCSRGGYIFHCPAIYEDGKVLTGDSDWNWYEIEYYAEYNEEADDYFVPQGWWESRHFTPDDVYNNPVDCDVTHWMPLPGWPEEENDG